MKIKENLKTCVEQTVIRRGLTISVHITYKYFRIPEGKMEDESDELARVLLTMDDGEQCDLYTDHQVLLMKVIAGIA